MPRSMKCPWEDTRPPCPVSALPASDCLRMGWERPVRGLSQGAKWWDKGHGAGPVHLGEGGQMGAGGKQGGLGGEKA